MKEFIKWITPLLDYESNEINIAKYHISKGDICRCFDCILHGRKMEQWQLKDIKVAMIKYGYTHEQLQELLARINALTILFELEVIAFPERFR